MIPTTISRSAILLSLPAAAAACQPLTEGPEPAELSLQIDGRVVEDRAWFVGELQGSEGGITNPAGADVRFVVRTHGPAIRGRIEEQLGKRERRLRGRHQPGDAASQENVRAWPRPATSRARFRRRTISKGRQR